MAPGAQFVEQIRRSIRDCDAVIVIVGPRWASELGAGGARRIDDSADYVRIEVAEALALGKLVVPILHDGARMPPDDRLPEDIAALAGRNAVELGDRNFGADLERIIEALQQRTARVPAGPRALAQAS